MRSAVRRLAVSGGLVAISALCLASSAQPAPAGHGLTAGYRFDGGTPAERSQVRAALRASSFDWSVVPAVVTIHIVADLGVSEAAPGEIWLDAGLLDSGMFAWGVVQHEYAHQVDFFCLGDAARALLLGELGGTGWWSTGGQTKHSDATAERFASTLAWAYWPSRLNVMSPADAGIESGSIPPARFRAIVSRVLAHSRR
jgi:hypothetical protein